MEGLECYVQDNSEGLFYAEIVGALEELKLRVIEEWREG